MNDRTTKMIISDRQARKITVNPLGILQMDYFYVITKCHVYYVTDTTSLYYRYQLNSQLVKNIKSLSV